MYNGILFLGENNGGRKTKYSELMQKASCTSAERNDRKKKYRIHRIQNKINKATLKGLFSINEGTFTRQNISINFGSSR